VSNSSGELFIVDDDQEACFALSEVFANAGYHATAFTDEKLFVRVARIRIPACVILSGLSSLDVLIKLNAESYPAPVLILSRRNDIPSAVEAVRNGACDFIEKRLDADAILGRVRAAIDSWERRRHNDDLSEKALPLLPGYDLLTNRELQVLFQITSAASIKETSRNLGISPRTVAVHRRHIMQKLSVRDSVNLMRAVLDKARGA
jgi:two-component system, LuxR family, response regulator FixJ